MTGDVSGPSGRFALERKRNLLPLRSSKSDARNWCLWLVSNSRNHKKHTTGPNGDLFCVVITFMDPAVMVLDLADETVLLYFPCT